MVTNIVDENYVMRIKEVFEGREPHSQREISEKIGEMDRAILMGYLRCLVDLGILESKYMGRTKIYFLKREKKLFKREKRPFKKERKIFERRKKR